jgi:FixJ family two-component response regulator
MTTSALVCIVDDDRDVRHSTELLLRGLGYRTCGFADAASLLASPDLAQAGCILLDLQLGESNGLDVQKWLADREIVAGIVLISGHGDIPSTVAAMKSGAISFLAKPIAEAALVAAVDEALARGQERRRAQAERALLQNRYDSLTPREREILDLVVAGLMNKQIAGRLGISEITVKIHRGQVMRKMAAPSLPDLVRMAEGLGMKPVTSRYGRD